MNAVGDIEISIIDIRPPRDGLRLLERELTSYDVLSMPSSWPMAHFALFNLLARKPLH